MIKISTRTALLALIALFFVFANGTVLAQDEEEFDFEQSQTEELNTDSSEGFDSDSFETDESGTGAGISEDELETTTEESESSATQGGARLQFFNFLLQNSGVALGGVVATAFASGLITALVVGLLLKRFMRLSIARINQSPFKTWGIGLGGLVGIAVVVAIVIFLFSQIPAVMGYTFTLVAGLVWGAFILLGVSLYLAGALISVLIGSWIESIVTNPERKAPVSWWGIVGGYVVFSLAGGLLYGVSFVSPVLGGILSFIVINLIVIPLAIGGVWQTMWLMGVKRSSNN